VELLLPLAAARRLAAVVLADDEAVLVANRLPVQLPVVDEVDVEAALRADRLAVETSAQARPLRALPDPLRLGELLGLGDDELADAAALAPLLLDATNAVVALGGRRLRTRPVHRRARRAASGAGRDGPRLLPPARPGDVRRR